MENQGLTERQETILALIIHEYIDLANPVGSSHLVEKFDLGVSSATVRNEMARLADYGLLRQPHTSAGRIPTEAGYRYFVGKLLGDAELPSTEKRMISHQFHQVPSDMEEWVRLAASVLAQKSNAASLVTPPHPDRAVFKHLELISTHGRRALMILVLDRGDVHQQMLTLTEVIDQGRLSQSASAINQLCVGKGVKEISSVRDKLDPLGVEFLELVINLMKSTNEVWAREIHRDGLTNVLAQPEFADTEGGRFALQLLEEQHLLEEIFAKTLDPGVGSVQVVIGGEGTWEELNNCSMVLARYGDPQYATGALGILGPTRMAYGRSISTVRYVANLMSNLVVETMAG